MKNVRVYLAGMAFLLSPIAAQAADIVAEEPAVYDWTGFFVGANAGYGFGADDTIKLESEDFDSVGGLDMHGFIGGGQLGANWQAGTWVLGAEADMQFADISDSQFHELDDVSVDTKGSIDWLSTVRLRSGVAFDRMFLYGTGGIAFGGVDYKVSVIDDATTSDLREDYTATGWTAGAGVEWGLSDKSSAKLEFLYIDLGDKSVDDLAGSGTRLKLQPTAQSLRLGLDYRF
jgi:outer membrane immunogenic protein